MKQKYPVTLYSDPEGGYVVEIKDLLGCISQGETVEDALAEIEDARALWIESAWIESAYEHDDPIPLKSDLQD
ncbi:type II toxin-antitoxin system HicB family antitoxin [Myxacorys almedinensis]|uniref:Type II toxin-antitoxin system HicB family antitoxin n=1 Tax=Myxacorys almedinensis A TaxID=2690445 RepID=A0A8J7YYN9_9CYAN|nr:type II toxin-antitoxin system HicB family antitoxin [Myxacorys almedinensis]NDJ16494.1 type II toxin-antitoxin system HicB family antitoxin [Myxacorys almedinensis A]